MKDIHASHWLVITGSTPEHLFPENTHIEETSLNFHGWWGGDAFDTISHPSFLQRQK